MRGFDATGSDIVSDGSELDVDEDDDDVDEEDDDDDDDDVACRAVRPLLRPNR